MKLGVWRLKEVRISPLQTDNTTASLIEGRSEYFGTVNRFAESGSLAIPLNSRDLESDSGETTTKWIPWTLAAVASGNVFSLSKVATPSVKMMPKLGALALRQTNQSFTPWLKNK